MSIEQLNTLPNEEEVTENAREYWKEKANLLGISFVPNIPTDKLKSLVQAKLAEPVGNDKGKVYTSKLSPEVRAMQDEANRLVRFKITVLDPSKHSWTGMYVTAGNDNLSPIRRAVYFIEEAWHAEKIIVEALKTMRYAYRPTEKSRVLKGTFNKYEAPQMKPVFQIEELPPLTEEELQDLMKYQAQNNTGQQES